MFRPYSSVKCAKVCRSPQWMLPLKNVSVLNTGFPMNEKGCHMT